jgi:parvulin-like peptidyl-prolyl isomerase
MSMLRTISLSITIGAILAFSGAWAQVSETSYDIAQSKDKLPKGIVATYKGGEISEEDFQNKIKSIPFFQRGDPMNPKDISWKHKLIKDMAANQILSQKAIKDNLDKEEDFLKAYKEQESKELLDILFQKEVKDKAKVSDKEISDYYNTHKDSFVDPETIKFRYIFVDTYATRTTDAQKKEALEKINKAYSLLKEGKSFVDVAKEYSEVEESRRGEIAGPFQVGPSAQRRIARVLEETATSMQPGSFSSIMTTEKGYHIIYLEEHKLAYQNPISEVKEEIVKILEAGVIKNRIADVISAATTGLKIVTHPEYLSDSTAKNSDIILSMPDYKMTIQDFRELSNKMMMGHSTPEQEAKFLDIQVRNQGLARYARKLKLDKSPEFKKAMETFKNQYLGEKWLTKEVNNKVKITDAMAKDFYDQNTASFMTEKEYYVRNIYVKANITKDTPPDERTRLLSLAKETAQMALNELKNGLDFATTAQKYSTIPNAKEGGLIGWYSTGPMGHIFDIALSKLTTGQTSELLDMRDGYQIIKLEKVKDPVLNDFDKVIDKARQMAEGTEKIKTRNAIIESVLKEVNFKYDSSRF